MTRSDGEEKRRGAGEGVGEEDPEGIERLANDLHYSVSSGRRRKEANPSPATFWWHVTISSSRFSTYKAPRQTDFVFFKCQLRMRNTQTLRMLGTVAPVLFRPGHPLHGLQHFCYPRYKTSLVGEKKVLNCWILLNLVEKTNLSIPSNYCSYVIQTYWTHA